MINRTFLQLAVLAIALVALISCGQEKRTAIDLSGEWTVKLDPKAQGQAEKWFTGTLNGTSISLPGTLDEAEIGTPTTLKPELNNYVLSHLTRKHSYTGKAWYQRKVTVPASWDGKQVQLKLERVLWKSQVWVDDQRVEGFQESLITPHYFDLSSYLGPGEHTLTVLVDNSNDYPGINVAGNKYPAAEDKDMAHAYTNHTQIKWNGILGEISLKATSGVEPEVVQVYADTEKQQLKINVSASQKVNEAVKVSVLKNGKEILQAKGQTDAGVFTTTLDATDLEQWDEFNPVVYQCKVTMGSESKVVDFGYRTVSNANAQLTINGQRTFMRGNLECVIFPETGRPPMQTSEWTSLMKMAKGYGLNHLRFHSWCPPKAAFEAADQLGMYLQVELPFWNLSVGKDPKTNDFLYQEARHMIREYGNHPSFVFFSTGNELEGDTLWLNELVAKMKTWDNSHLYMTTTFSFQKGVGDMPQPEDEYFVTQWTNKGWIRGQGIFNARAPHFDKDYRNEIDHIDVPVISHEIGQYSVYPDLSEIEKYTGVLQPLNFMAVRDDLERKGLLKHAADFTQASGELAALLYKEEIERALKTPTFDGFQLLQLQDFPGQGTALVGLLNAFWESKGMIDSTEFAQFSGPVVPLIRFPKAVYASGETFEAEVQVANFYRPFAAQNITWRIFSDEAELGAGTFSSSEIPVGNEAVFGSISQKLEVAQASKLTVEVAIEGTSYKNQWPIWVYPNADSEEGDVRYTRSLDQALQWLAKGETVLLNPPVDQLRGVTGRFVPVFWSPVHFPDQPATMGILCDPEHPALADFPTEFHSNWQWWDLCIQSKSLILDEAGIEPIVRVVDNFVTNRSLGNLFEAKVGNGKLLFSAIDLQDDLNDRLVARQLRNSLSSYMNSDAFAPKQELTAGDLKTLFN
ncbi:sugar-binding domain-containing protein [Marinoscillum furvescens]|uniref:Glycosyl hydrolase family 2 n=1 Tax=Marinoscillum furvescens DSM 4134 TaxID=1122208 RepID=A0A3D9L769_MARFU|nr:sugar-binding domain-containing protein [Marinoscillum furvescens]REE02211.1 glycosyl hydrolase family 2 [Marinoscillum furvescens DSM 4134]